MNWFTAFVLFVLIWWTALFAVLPLGTRPVSTPDPKTGWRGAPDAPRLGRKLLTTTAISLAIWAGCMGVITSNWVSFRHGYLALPQD